MADWMEIIKGQDAATKDKLVVSVEDIRKRLRDLPKYNEIVRQELSDDELAEAILDMIMDFNALPPFVGTYDPFTFPDRKLLIDLSIIEAIGRLAIWHARNTFSASDSGLQVPVHEQWQPLQGIAGALQARTDRRADRLKAMLNVQRGWGDGVSSPLWLR